MAIGRVLICDGCGEMGHPGRDLAEARSAGQCRGIKRVVLVRYRESMRPQWPWRVRAGDFCATCRRGKVLELQTEQAAKFTKAGYEVQAA